MMKTIAVKLTSAIALIGASSGFSPATLQAAVLIADFTNDNPIERTAAYDPDGLTNLNTTGWQQDTTNSGTSHTFRYNISGFGLGDASELLVTVSTSNGTSTMRPAAGNGIAVNGGANDNWWDASDNVDLDFLVSIRDGANTDITGDFTIDLTGVAMRWGADQSATFAGTSATQSSTLQGIDLPTGQTSETSFSFTGRTGNAFAQVQQLRLSVIPEPSAALLLFASTGLLLLRRRR